MAPYRHRTDNIPREQVELCCTLKHETTSQMVSSAFTSSWDIRYALCVMCTAIKPLHKDRRKMSKCRSEVHCLV